jgi:hypothetical protein
MAELSDLALSLLLHLSLEGGSIIPDNRPKPHNSAPMPSWRPIHRLVELGLVELIPHSQREFRLTPAGWVEVNSRSYAKTA